MLIRLTSLSAVIFRFCVQAFRLHIICAIIKSAGDIGPSVLDILPILSCKTMYLIKGAEKVRKRLKSEL